MNFIKAFVLIFNIILNLNTSYALSSDSELRKLFGKTISEFAREYNNRGRIKPTLLDEYKLLFRKGAREGLFNQDCLNVYTTERPSRVTTQTLRGPNSDERVRRYLTGYYPQQGLVMTIKVVGRGDYAKNQRGRRSDCIIQEM